MEQSNIAFCVEQLAGEEKGSSLPQSETFLKIIFNPTSQQERLRKAEWTSLTRTASGTATPVMNFYLKILERGNPKTLLWAWEHSEIRQADRLNAIISSVLWTSLLFIPSLLESSGGKGSKHSPAALQEGRPNTRLSPSAPCLTLPTSLGEVPQKRSKPQARHLQGIQPTQTWATINARKASRFRASDSKGQAKILYPSV